MQGFTSALRERVNEEQPAYGQDSQQGAGAPSFLADADDPKQSIHKMSVNREPSDARSELVDTKADLLQQQSSLADTTSASSPAIHIKPEPSATPRESTPAQVPGFDDETLKTVEALKNEHGLRGSGTRKHSSPSVPAMPVDSKPNTSANKKRPPPKSTASTTKKGTASAVKKPPTKKRKVDPRADGGSPTATPMAANAPAGSATPSSRTSKTPAFRGGNAPSSSPAPRFGSSPSAHPPGSDDIEEDEATDDNERYCICRRPDNHTWMIACDGGCDDWFHGSCVHIAESDGDLIDTYICPNCERDGRGRTSWKAMCRREGCRKPARVGSVSGKKGAKGEKSKYCSEECGVRFFQEKLGLEDKEMQKGGKRGRERRKSNFTDNIVNASQEEDLGSRGGALRVGEVAALVDAVPDLASFRALGEGVLSPPATVIEADGQAKESSKDLSTSAEAFLNEAERTALARIEKRKEELRAKHSLFREREKFIATCKEQHGKVAEREGVEPKNICGYNSRLSWSDEQFHAWSEKQKQKQMAKKEDGDETMTNGDGNTGEEDGAKGEGEVCMKKKCTRHSNWKQLVLQDVRFEVADVGDEMRRVDKEEKEIRERAMVRWRETVYGGGDDARVEVVEDIEAKTDAEKNEDTMDVDTEHAEEGQIGTEMDHSPADKDAELKNETNVA